MVNNDSNSTILVVDDDLDITTVVALGLEKAGYEVHAFNDPLKALEHLAEGCSDCKLLVSDIKMPRMNGFELVRAVRKIRPEIKVIMMTAFEVNIKEFESIFPSTPVSQLIRKPFAPSQLLVHVKAVMTHPESGQVAIK